MPEKTFKNGEIYDLIYQYKNYEKELDFIESLFPNNPKRILELGCGTGNYTKILLEKGYDVLSLDLSEKMLETARKKVVNGNFIQGDIKDFELHEKYDSCLILFAVLGYITENNDVKKVFENIKKHLNPGGILIFDVWNGLAVLNQKPEKRLKKVENEKIKISRYATTELNTEKHTCDVNYHFKIKEKIDNSIYEINEKHKIRFFFPQELRKYLEESGFEILKMCAPFEPDNKINENSWNIIIVAKFGN